MKQIMADGLKSVTLTVAFFAILLALVGVSDRITDQESYLIFIGIYLFCLWVFITNVFDAISGVKIFADHHLFGLKVEEHA